MSRQKKIFCIPIGMWSYDSITWFRECPYCKSEIKHKGYRSCIQSFEQNRGCVCRSAWSKGLTKETNSSLKLKSEKMSVTMKKKFKDGDLTPWNKGLTRDTNDILAKMGDNHKGFKHTEETKLKISENSKSNWRKEEYRNSVLTGKAKVMDQQVNRWIRTMVDRGYFTDPNDRSELKNYRYKVWIYTNRNDLSVLSNYDKRGKAGLQDSYHLDHKFSITQGFRNNIDPMIIGSIHNLEFIPWMENQIKKTNCSISKEELLRLYEKESEILHTDNKSARLPNESVEEC